MTDIQRSVLMVTSALAILLVALILRATGKQVDKVRPVEAKLAFDAVLACSEAKTLAAEFPERGTGTPQSRSAADWIRILRTILPLEWGHISRVESPGLPVIPDCAKEKA